MIKIRIASENDFDALSKLYLEMEEEGKYPEYFEEITEDDNKKIIIAEQGKKIIGLVEIFSEEDSFYINNLIIAQGYRNNGIGSLLINEVKILAKELEIKKINITVYQSQKRIEEFYEKNGFKDYSKQMYVEVK